MSSENCKYPQYYIVGIRPVKLLDTHNGELDCQVYQWESGEFQRDISYLSRCIQGEGDVDKVSQIDFEERVKELRQRLSNKQSD
ncbi:hypothetical protein [Mastigocoleus sp. MO_188.B34]|uniref:hypothetical protein n=1 Tax=Mastigocoleus sp. MO_188.B34 TaxID=3036635 RepID=UPI0026362726|nr:hypothetical protein [Mastigocoleus sp. MO_188.B34]MDJ0696922.1 hypothetical protein [Mastigocoleus sp. MO_188.B34]